MKYSEKEDCAAVSISYFLYSNWKDINFHQWSQNQNGYANCRVTKAHEQFQFTREKKHHTEQNG